MINHAQEQGCVFSFSKNMKWIALNNHLHIPTRQIQAFLAFNCDTRICKLLCLSCRLQICLQTDNGNAQPLVSKWLIECPMSHICRQRLTHYLARLYTTLSNIVYTVHTPHEQHFPGNSHKVYISTCNRKPNPVLPKSTNGTLIRPRQPTHNYVGRGSTK